MGKVPVGRTSAGAYRFLALRPGTVVGLGWLPAAFYAGAVWFCIQRLGAAMQVAVPSSATFNEFTAVDFLALLVATALLVPTVLVPFTQSALGVKRDPVAAHFVFGWREARLALALLRYYAIVIAVLVALAFALDFAIGIGLPKPGTLISGFGMPAQWQGTPMVVWLDGAAAFVLAIVYLFLAVRLGFYLAPQAAVEETVTLRRAWTLSSGGFWRLAIIHVAVAVPAALLFGAAIYAIEGDALNDVLRTAWTGVPSEGVGALYRLQYEHGGALAGVWALGMIVASALFSGASATAYRALEGAEEAPEVSRQRTEPDFTPAWAAAKAMADASPRHERFEPRMVAAPVEYATPEQDYIAQEPVAEHAEQSAEHVEQPIEYAGEPLVEHEVAVAAPVEELAAPEPVAEPQPEIAPEPEHIPTVTFEQLAHALTSGPLAAQAQTPAEIPLPPAPPLDPAGVFTMREQAGQLGESAPAREN
jgi:hypothetical protein